MGGDARPVEAKKHRLGEHTADGHVHDVGYTAHDVSERDDTFDRRRSLKEALAKAESGRALLAKSTWLGESLSGGTEADNTDHVLEPASSRSLLGTTAHEGLESHSPADDESPDPGRTAELVGAERDKVGTKLVEADREVPNNGGAVEVYWHA